jgi:hypothetical protein
MGPTLSSLWLALSGKAPLTDMLDHPRSMPNRIHVCAAARDQKRPKPVPPPIREFS